MSDNYFVTYKRTVPPPEDFIQQENIEEDPLEYQQLINDYYNLLLKQQQDYANQSSLFQSDYEEEPKDNSDQEQFEMEWAENKLSDNIINTGRDFLNYKYTWGGQDPKTGFDCSGFLWYIFKKNGINIPRTTGGLFNFGKQVEMKDARPGDIICSRGSGSTGRHVQMISKIENGQIWVIEAKDSKHGIVEEPLTKKQKDIFSIRRIIKVNKNDPFLFNSRTKSFYGSYNSSNLGLSNDILKMSSLGRSNQDGSSLIDSFWNKTNGLSNEQSNVAQQMISQIINSGYSYSNAIGIISNVYSESGFNRTASNINSNGTTDYGLFQLNSAGHKKAFEKKYGNDWSIKNQVQYVIDYMKNTSGLRPSDMNNMNEQQSALKFLSAFEAGNYKTPGDMIKRFPYIGKGSTTKAVWGMNPETRTVNAIYFSRKFKNLNI